MKDLKSNKNIKLAVPNKGRLMQPTLDLLIDMGLQFDIQERKLYSPCLNFNLSLLFLRAKDIPEYVEKGIVDLGITGSDLIEEKEAKINKILNLGYGKCNLSLAIPFGSNIKNIEDISKKKIATSFPVLTKKFLRKENIKADVIEVEGAAEVTPWIGVADAIVDIVSTGESLAMHNLKPLETIFNAETVLVANKNLNGDKKYDTQKFIDIMEGVLNGRRKKYLMMNAPESTLREIKKIIPGLKSPTILKLAQPGMIAIHSVVDEDIIWDIIPKLKKIGASGILVSSIEKLISFEAILFTESLAKTVT